MDESVGEREGKGTRTSEEVERSLGWGIEDAMAVRTLLRMVGRCRRKMLGVD